MLGGGKSCGGVMTVCPYMKVLAAFRVRPDADPTYIHDVCKQELKEHPGSSAEGAALLLKCDNCNQVIGEWLSQNQMKMELQA